MECNELLPSGMTSVQDHHELMTRKTQINATYGGRTPLQHLINEVAASNRVTLHNEALLPGTVKALPALSIVLCILLSQAMANFGGWCLVSKPWLSQTDMLYLISDSQMEGPNGGHHSPILVNRCVRPG